MQYELTTPCTAADLAPLKAGDTVLLPAACPEVGLEGHGRALVSGVGSRA